MVNLARRMILDFGVFFFVSKVVVSLKGLDFSWYLLTITTTLKRVLKNFVSSALRN